MEKTPPIIISLGGSLIAPESSSRGRARGDIDAAFLKKFRDLIRRRIVRGDRFVIVCGGGATARRYQNAAKALGRLTREDIDWLGIHATRLNAHLVRAMFHRDAHIGIVTHPDDPPRLRASVLVAAGWKPGWSTDYIAVLLAHAYGAEVVVNLSDVDYVYSADPRTHRQAKPLEQVSWEDFRGIVGDRWDPGANLPFDPVASKRAARLGLTVKMVKGHSLKEVALALDGRKFKGTVIA